MNEKKQSTVSQLYAFLDLDLAITYPQAGTVCVGTDHAESIARLVLAPHSERHDGGLVAGHKTLPHNKGDGHIKLPTASIHNQQRALFQTEY